MLEDLKLAQPWTGSAYQEPYNLPRSLEESLRLLKACKPLAQLLGERFIAAYSAVKEAKHREFLQVISSWERRHLLLNV